MVISNLLKFGRVTFFKTFYIVLDVTREVLQIKNILINQYSNFNLYLHQNISVI